VLRNEKNPNFRADTALGLAFIKWDQRVTDALIEALNDTELTWSESLLTGTQYGVSVATMATEALAKQGNKRGIEAIAPRILEGMWTVEHTMEVFRYMGPPAIEYLVPGLKMEKWISRERAAASLGEIGDAQSTDALIAALGDEHWKVRRRAAEALGKIKDTTAIEPLSKALDDESGDVQDKARDALVRIGGPAVIALIQALKHEDANVRQRAAFALGDIGSAKALDALTEAKEDKSGWVRNAVKGAIKKIQKK
jgi:HEAT repeat protein